MKTPYVQTLSPVFNLILHWHSTEQLEEPICGAGHADMDSLPEGASGEIVVVEGGEGVTRPAAAADPYLAPHAPTRPRDAADVLGDLRG